MMLILVAVGRRFGWKGQSLLIILVAFGQPLRERIWFTTMLPVMTTEAGLVPYLAAAAFYAAGLSVGLLIAQSIGGKKWNRLRFFPQGAEARKV